jgi:ATP synthase protein I
MVTSDPNQDPDGVEDPRLASLDARLSKVQHAEKERTTQAVGNLGMTGKGASQGNRVLSVLLGYPMGGALIGWFLDRQLGTTPKALLALLALGVIAAGRTIWQISKERVE